MSDKYIKDPVVPGYGQYVCELILEKEISRAASLARDAEFYCASCGRAAADEDRLCAPLVIESTE